LSLIIYTDVYLNVTQDVVAFLSVLHYIVNETSQIKAQLNTMITAILGITPWGGTNQPTNNSLSPNVGVGL